VGRKLEQLQERPSRPFTPRAGPAWPARILQAGDFYHVKEQLVYCGVDIAKSYLEAVIGKEKRRLANDAMGHREFIKWIKQIEGQAGDLRTQRRLRAAVYPGAGWGRDQSQFGASQSGAIDARALCAFGEAMQPPMVTTSKLEQEQLRELESQRRHLSRLLVMEQNRGARLADCSVRVLNRSLIKQIQKQIEKIDLLIKEHIGRVPRALVQSSQTDGDQRSRSAHGRIASGPDAGTGTTQSQRSRGFGRSRPL